jgi:hypothetical protein
MLKNTGLSVAILLCLLIGGTHDASAHVNKSPLRERRVTLQLANQPLNEVFARLTIDYDVPIGFEESVLDIGHGAYRFETDVPFEGDQRIRWSDDLYFRSDAGGRPVVRDHLISVDYRNARLEEVLNDIVVQMKNYTWDIDDDVVNIFPLRERNPVLEKLMDVKVAKFSASDGTTIEWLPVMLRKLPEFQAYRSEHDLNQDITQYTSFRERELPEMEFVDLTFKQLLNSILRVKRGAWIVRTTQRGVAGRTISILL